MEHKKKQFSEKHGAGVKPDSKIKDEVLKRAQKDELSCAVAFEIAKGLGIAVGAVGITADLINVELVKCQLGLFGYKPKKKIVKPKAEVNQDTTDAIRDRLVEGKLPCKSAWDIADRFKVSKLTTSEACEALGIRIKGCQLGAF